VRSTQTKTNLTMKATSRRTFLRGGLSAATGIALSARAAEPQAGPRCLDYGQSFVCNTAAFNSVRMWIESRTTIVDPQAGTRTDYFQCGSCKSERTFAPRDLFNEDNYDFMPIFGDGRVLVIRRRAAVHDAWRQIKRMEDMWGEPVLRLREPAVVTELDTWEKVRDATAAGIPIVTQTELHNAETGLRAVIECPCKTMNISQPKRMYQVDTGPVALPDLTRRYDPQIESLSLAFIAFNAPDIAYFVTDSPTPITIAGKEVASIHHYSKLSNFPAKNRLLALGRL
jgi:hypothetical protein